MDDFIHSLVDWVSGLVPAEVRRRIAEAAEQRFAVSDARMADIASDVVRCAIRRRRHAAAQRLDPVLRPAPGRVSALAAELERVKRALRP
ncbi:hypothetical protein [Streptomyces sp. URMC 129]|uniref:hypothetical protein n=1 Tax=Streptomyces sp. URMC 129 TaxID=3423407 RepID=UPI003F1E35DF